MVGLRAQCVDGRGALAGKVQPVTPRADLL